MRPYGAILADNIANGDKKLPQEQPQTKVATPAKTKIEPKNITNFRQAVINGAFDNGQQNNTSTN